MKVVAYCRVSNEKEEEDSKLLKKQIELFENYSKAKEFELVKVYVDRGISTRKVENRHSLQAMLRDAHTDKFKLILVNDVSRFTRKTSEFLDIMAHFNRNNVDVRFLNDSIENPMNYFDFKKILYASLKKL